MARLDEPSDLFEPDRPLRLLLAEQHDHRHGFGERPFEIGAAVDLDHARPGHPHRLVIGEALALRDHDPVDHALDEGQAQHLDRIVAGDAGRRRQCHCGSAAAGDEAPFGPGQFGDAPTRRLHQLVEVDEMARGLGHRRPHLRQHQTAAVHRAHAAAIDERPHAEREIRVGVHDTSDPGRSHYSSGQ
jgi:hypothetical protein